VERPSVNEENAFLIPSLQKQVAAKSCQAKLFAWGPSFFQSYLFAMMIAINALH